MPKKQTTLALPTMVAGPVEIGHLARELETIDEKLLQLKLRNPGSEIKMPLTSQLMDQTTQLNKLNLLHENDRQTLKQFLEYLRQKAPVINMSFSADPTPVFIEKLMIWLRQEIHPLLLLRVGLQPNLGAGCVLHTTNKYFDLSLRQDFASKRDLLRESLRSTSTRVRT